MQQVRATALAGVEESRVGFLAKAAAESGAKKTESGAIVTTIKEGKGTTPKATDTVKVHYHGTLIDGTVFDSSVKRGGAGHLPAEPGHQMLDRSSTADQGRRQRRLVHQPVGHRLRGPWITPGHQARRHPDFRSGIAGHRQAIAPSEGLCRGSSPGESFDFPLFQPS